MVLMLDEAVNAVSCVGQHLRQKGSFGKARRSDFTNSGHVDFLGNARFFAARSASRALRNSLPSRQLNRREAEKNRNPARSRTTIPADSEPTSII